MIGNRSALLVRLESLQWVVGLDGGDFVIRPLVLLESPLNEYRCMEGISSFLDLRCKKKIDFWQKKIIIKNPKSKFLFLFYFSNLG
jgi:hypothetical protein